MNIKDIEKEFDKRFNGYWRGEAIPDEIKFFFRSAIQQAMEAVRLEERKLPTHKCLNAESHLFGACFQCEKIKGYNEAIAEMRENITNFMGK